MPAKFHNSFSRNAILTCALIAFGSASSQTLTQSAIAAPITSDYLDTPRQSDVSHQSTIHTDPPHQNSRNDSTTSADQSPPSLADDPAADAATHDANEFQPRTVAFRLADGARVRGTLTRWDHATFDGSFGQHNWNALKPEDVWRLHQDLIDRDNPRHWIALGRTLLLMREEQRTANRWAERAFHRARRAARVDEDDATRDKSEPPPEDRPEDHPDAVFDVDDAIDAVYADVEAIERDRARLRELDRDRRLETRSPEARDWPATPWPDLTTDEQRTAINAMRADAQRILDGLGLSTEPIEGSVFLLYTDLPRTEAIQYLTLLEDLNHQFSQFMRLPPRENLFWGKAVIMIFREQDRFRLASVEGFGHYASSNMVGIAQTLGPRVFILLHHETNARTFELELIRHTVLGLLHRLDTPRRLPPWAAEGLAEHLAEKVVDRPWHLEERRERALKFIREGGNLNSLLELHYDDERWPARQALVASVGSLMLELMHRERPNGLLTWLRAVKQGTDWREALETHYGTTHKRLIDLTVRYYKVND